MSAAEAIPVDPWLEHLRQHLPIAREGSDPEGVHQVRVAAGRLRVWLELAGREVPDDDLRWLRKRADAVRDLDVLLEEDPPEAWAAWLRGERERAREPWLETFEHPRLAGLLAALESLPPIPVERAAEGLGALVRRVVRRGRRARRREASDARLHDLRRALRRLRYGLDWLGRSEPVVKELQQAFGRVNDLSVTREWLERSPATAALNGFADELAADHRRARGEAQALWRERAELVEGLA